MDILLVIFIAYIYIVVIGLTAFCIKKLNLELHHLEKIIIAFMISTPITLVIILIITIIILAIEQNIK